MATHTGAAKPKESGIRMASSIAMNAWRMKGTRVTKNPQKELESFAVAADTNIVVLTDSTLLATNHQSLIVVIWGGLGGLVGIGPQGRY